MLAPRPDLPLGGPPVGPPAAPPVEPPVGCADGDCSRPTRINPSGRLLLAVGPSSGEEPIGGIPPPPIPPPPMPPRPPPWPRCDPGARWGEVALGSGPILSGSSLRLKFSFHSPVRFTPLGAAASS